MEEVRLAVRDGHGSYGLWVADTEDHIARNITATGRPYEGRLLRLLDLLLADDDVVVDVGANIGNHAVSFARSGAIVHAVESNPKAAELLDRNVEENDLTERVTVHRVGLSDRVGRGRARVRIPGNLGSAVVDADPDGPVRLVPFDALQVPRPVRMVKIDVEGAELAVLRGCAQMLTTDRPLLVVELQTRESRREAGALLTPLGYRMLPVSLSGEPTFLFVDHWAAARPLLGSPLLPAQAARRLASRLRGFVLDR